jgi:predicted nucleic acid-binding protein
VIFLLDTTAFSDLMQENPRIQDKLATLAPADRVAISSIVRGEVRYGIERIPLGKRRDALEAKSLRLFAAIPCESVPPAAGDQYGRIKATSQKRDSRWTKTTCGLPPPRYRLALPWSAATPIFSELTDWL